MTGKLELANKFNAFFTNIVNNLANNIKYKGIHEHSYYRNKKLTMCLHKKEYTIKRIINNLPNKNSCGFDGFSTKLLNMIEPAINKSFNIINKQSIDHRSVP